GRHGRTAARCRRLSGAARLCPHPIACRRGDDQPGGHVLCLAAGRRSEASIMDNSVPHSRLHADDVTIGYDRQVISSNLSVAIPEGSFTVIVGANACGKSTLLRALARLIKPSAGQIVLDGKAISDYPAREVARR